MTASAVEPVPRPTSMPGWTRSAAAMARRWRRAASSTSGGAPQLGGGVLVDEPTKRAVRKTRANRLRRETDRLLWSFEDRFEGVCFSRTAGEEENLAAGVKQGIGKCQAVGIELGHKIGGSKR